MICAFNAKGFLTDPAMKSAFGLMATPHNSRLTA